MWHAIFISTNLQFIAKLNAVMDTVIDAYNIMNHFWQREQSISGTVIVMSFTSYYPFSFKEYQKHLCCSKQNSNIVF
jgi:hypothetical protein